MEASLGLSLFRNIAGRRLLIRLGNVGRVGSGPLIAAILRVVIGQSYAQLLSKKLVFTPTTPAFFPLSAKFLLRFAGKKRFDLFLTMARLLAKHHPLPLLRRESREDITFPFVVGGIAR